MLSTISAIAYTIWSCLPETTVCLQFATALIRFYLAAALAVQRWRKRTRRHERGPEPGHLA